jgi:hypothetical protein
LAIQDAALNGHLTTLEHLETHLTVDEKKAAVMADNYLAIRYAALNGHLTTLEHLETHLTDAEKKAAVMADNYLAIQDAALNGHLTTLEHLETHLTDAEKKAAVMARDCDYLVTQDAAQNGHLTTREHPETHLIAYEKSKESSSSLSNINMQVLGGFMAVLGSAAVATAFVLLNAATFGIPGLIVAGLGFASILSGVGLFAASTYVNRQEKPRGSLVDSSSLPDGEFNSGHS